MKRLTPILLSLLFISGTATAKPSQDAEPTPIKLYMEHQTTTQKVKRQTELKLMNNKKSLAEIESMNIERKLEFDALKHKKDLQSIQLEIAQQTAKLNELEATSKAKKILDEANKILTHAQEVKIGLDKDQALLGEAQEQYNVLKATYDEDLIQLELHQKELKEAQELNDNLAKKLNQSEIEISDKQSKLDILVNENLELKKELRKQLDEIGVSLEYQDQQERKVSQQQSIIKSMSLKLAGIEKEINLHQEEQALSTNYTLIYTNGVEAMVRFGNDERTVTKGSNVGGLTVKEIDGDSITLSTKNGLIKKISIGYNPY